LRDFLGIAVSKWRSRPDLIGSMIVLGSVAIHRLLRGEFNSITVLRRRRIFSRLRFGQISRTADGTHFRIYRVILEGYKPSGAVTHPPYGAGLITQERILIQIDLMPPFKRTEQYAVQFGTLGRQTWAELSATLYPVWYFNGRTVLAKHSSGE
jgi:hypothetical protein